MFKEPFKCPHCKATLTKVAYSRVVVQMGDLELSNLWFNKGTVDDDEINEESAQCPECEKEIDVSLIPGLTS